MRLKQILKSLLIIILSFLIVLLGALLIFISTTLTPIKNLDTKLDNITHSISTFYSDDNQKIENLGNKKNNYVKLSDIPTITKQAFISIEDKEFYNHHGYNPKRIVKATFNNIKSGKFKEGASTITQQLVKNKFLTKDKKIKRKIQELYLSIKLEKTETKDKILETYLNSIYFGNGAYGIKDASKTFFNKSPNELTLSESCVLAGVIKSPTNYSPLNNLEQSTKRRNLVLKELHKDKIITEEEYLKCINEEIDITNAVIDYNVKALDLYTQNVLEEASEILNTNSNNILYGNYKIYTYQNSDIQKHLDNVIYDEKNYHKNSYGNIADSLAIVIDNNHYGVSAISGKSKYNLLNFKRQPGSLIKPIFTYLPALEKGLINSKTQILDEPINYNGYSPNNVGNTFDGYISVEDCVAKSLNIPTIKITEKVGLNNCINYAKKSGLELSTVDTGYAIALGGLTDGVSLKNITDSYSVLTNNGNYIKSKFVKRIVNSANMTIYENIMSENMVYSDDSIYLMTDILKTSVSKGTSKKLSKFNFDIAGKTGTVAVKNSNLNTDAYSLAYTTNHTMSVWLGNYTMQNEYNLSGKNNGGTYATQMIVDTFDQLYKNNIPEKFEKPESVIECNIDEQALSEEHIVLLGNNIPDRYKIKTLFSTRYLPQIESDRYNNVPKIELKTNVFKNSVELNFDTLEYIQYEIYRIINNQTQKIATIKNKNIPYIFIDKDIPKEEKLSYYVLGINNFTQLTNKSNVEEIYINKDFNNLINKKIDNKIDNFNWIFH